MENVWGCSDTRREAGYCGKRFLVIRDELSSHTEFGQSKNPCGTNLITVFMSYGSLCQRCSDGGKMRLERKWSTTVNIQDCSA